MKEDMGNLPSKPVRMYEKPDFDEVEKDKIIADDWTLIRPGHCRRCKGKIKPWTGSFIGAYYFCCRVELEIGQQSGYCKTCAKIKAAEFSNQYGYTPPLVTERYTDVYGTEHVKYEDGSGTEFIGAGDTRYPLYGGME